MKSFTQDFQRFKDKILSGENFAYARYADGEVRMMRGLAVPHDTQAFAMDGWSCEGRLYRLGQVLLESIAHTEPDYFYAITSPNQNYDEYRFLRDRIRVPEDNITFADLWINGNYERFRAFLFEEIREPVVLIASEDGAKRDLHPLRFTDYLTIPPRCPDFYEEHADEIVETLRGLAHDYRDTLFLISAGPMSEAIIHHLYGMNPRNRYIDVGSAIDELVHGKKTRPYMLPGSPYHGQIVEWTLG